MERFWPVEIDEAQELMDFILTNFWMLSECDEWFDLLWLLASSRQSIFTCIDKLFFRRN